ncbi:MAG: DUF3999 domain-containing protein [Betaproteobacteria bacterium]|nr:DUF3999 domain-containing protein [Betaproteobacteria bacterium]MCL2887306.1 DUF3999 domain-containing protein [Betaproteobacteria bacterium]
MPQRAAFALILAIAAAPLALAAPPSDAPDGYAARWPLQLPADASLTRLPLPAEVLTRVQTADLRDLRVFNAAGQPVPLALDRSSPDTRAPAPAAIELPALPIMAAGQTVSAVSAGLSLRIEEGPQGRVVRLDDPSAAASAPPALVGALIDAREQKIALQGIELDVDWPAARPFTFRLHVGSDLRQWQPLGEVTAYRGADGVLTAPPHVALHSVTLQGRYLRLTWDAVPDDTVQLRGVRLLPEPPQAAPARVAAPLALPEGAARDARVLEWRLPFATPLAALDIRAAGPAALVPVRVLARQQREQPWTPLARHVVFSLTQDGQMRHSPALELGQAAWREWRVVADDSSPGFTEPPQVTAWFEPAQLVFVVSGPPPFTLAVGRADAPLARLPLNSLIPGYEAGAQGKLPVASLAAEAARPPASAAAVTTTVVEAQRDLRSWTLWAILLAGVLALGGMAWILARQLDKPRSAARE